MKRKTVFRRHASAVAAMLVAAAVMFFASSAVFATELEPEPETGAGSETETETQTGSVYTGVNGTTTQFDKYLVLNSSADVPNFSFEYGISAASEDDIPADAYAVYPGVSPEKITVSGETDGDITDVNITNGTFLVNFTSADSTVDYADKPDTEFVKGLDEGEKYAKKTVTLNFGSVVFTEPGIYRYKITETRNNNPDPRLIYDTDNTRYLDVYVTNDETSETPALVVGPYVLHATDTVVTNQSEDNIGQSASDYKSQGFTNEYTSYTLTVRKNVEGNQASKDKYFEFTLNIENVEPGTVFLIDYTNADSSIPREPNAATTVNFGASDTSGSGDEPGTDNGTDTGSDPSTDNGTDTDTGSDPSTDNGTDTDTGSDPSTDSGTDTVTDPSTEEDGDDDHNAVNDNGDENVDDGGSNTSDNYVQPAAVTVPAESTSASQKLYLHHGQSIVIRGIPVDAKVTVTEAPEEYTSTVSINAGSNLTIENNARERASYTDSDKTHKVTLTRTSAEYENVFSDSVIIFTNSKEGVLPTGVILSVAGPAIIGILVICAIIFLVVRSRKRRLNEE